MAYNTTEVQRFRQEMTKLVNALRDIDPILAIVEDHGANDAARQAFLEPALTGQDIDWATFAAGVVALRAIKTARDANKLALAKLLV